MSGNDSDRKSSTRRVKCVVITVIVMVFVVVITLALGLGLGLGLRPHAPTTDDHLQHRIDCYPETRWGSVETADLRGECERRGCRYDPLTPSRTDADSGAPVCYVSEDSALGTGYSMSGLSERSDGLAAALRTNAEDLQSDVAIQPLNARLQVDYAGENVLHIKVGCIGNINDSKLRP